MSFRSLYSGKHGFLATDQLVYQETEITAVKQALEKAAALDKALEKQIAINEQAQREGFDSGYAAGLAQARADCLLQHNEEILALHKRYEESVIAQQDACAELALDIVRKIAGQVAPADWLVGEAKTAAAELVETDGLILRVNNNQLADVQQKLAASIGLFERVVADDNVPLNGCVIETRHGRIDVDLDTQIEQVLRLLTETEVNGV